MFASCQRSMSRASTLRSIREVKSLFCFYVVVEEHGEPELVSIRPSKGSNMPVALEPGQTPITTAEGLQRAAVALSPPQHSYSVKPTLSNGTILLKFDGKDDTFWSEYSVHNGGIVPLRAASFARRDLAAAMVLHFRWVYSYCFWPLAPSRRCRSYAALLIAPRSIAVRMIAVELLIVVSALAGAAITASNYAIIVRWYARRKHSSLIPALGGLLLGAAMLLVPTTKAKHYMWLPLIVDPGCFYLPASVVVFVLIEKASIDDASPDRIPQRRTIR